MEKGRRWRRVPAFGGWNYYYYSGELSTPAPAAAKWYAPAAHETEEASSDVWFKYSPPPRMAPPPPPNNRRKARRPLEMHVKSCERGKRSVQAATPARASAAGARKAKAARTPEKGEAATADTARSVQRSYVDADLYQVPPPEFEPDDQPTRRRRTKKVSSRSTWMACLGFSSCCVST